MKAFEAVKGEGDVTFVSVTVGPAGDARKFAEKHKLPYEVVYDAVEWGEKGSTPATFGFDGIPFNVLIDAEGKIAGEVPMKDVKKETPLVDRVKELLRAAAEAKKKAEEKKDGKKAPDGEKPAPPPPGKKDGTR